MIPFRISVSLNSFFNDQRSLSYILIDNRFQTIEDLENHIKTVFKLKPDCDICLISNNHLLPSSEEINLIHEGDSLQVSPVNKDFFQRSKSDVVHEEELQPPPKKRKISKKITNTACISIDDSSDEKDFLKVEPECTFHSTKKKKKKKSVQFGETFSNDTQQKETNETVPIEVDSVIDQRNVTDNKNIQILNIENVSNMELDTINSTNLESKIDENEIIFCNTECSASNIYKNEASTSKRYDLGTNSQFYNTESSTSRVYKNDNITQSFDTETNSKSNTACSTSKAYKNDTSTSKQYDPESSSNVGNTECSTSKIYKNDINTSKQHDLETSSKLCGNEATSKHISETNSIIKNNITNGNENECIVKNVDTSNEFIEHLRSSYNGGRGKIPPFTVGDFLNYANTVGHKQDNDIKNNINAPSTVHVTKRRRRRIRKRKSRNGNIDGNSSVNSISDMEFEFRRPLKTASPLLHIRFETGNKNENETMSNCTDTPMCSSTPNQEKTKLIVKKVNNKTGLNNHTSNNFIENNITANGIDNTRHKNEFHAPDVNDNYFKSIDLTNDNLENIKNVIMDKDVPPKVNDIIAFKLYELNENYEPRISNWIVGKILKWYPTEKFVDVFILAGHIKKNVPNGKFDLEEDSDDDVNEDERRNNNPSSIINLNFMLLIDPRLLIEKLNI